MGAFGAKFLFSAAYYSMATVGKRKKDGCTIKFLVARNHRRTYAYCLRGYPKRPCVLNYFHFSDRHILA